MYCEIFDGKARKRRSQLLKVCGSRPGLGEAGNRPYSACSGNMNEGVIDLGRRGDSFRPDSFRMDVGAKIRSYPGNKNGSCWSQQTSRQGIFKFRSKR